MVHLQIMLGASFGWLASLVLDRQEPRSEPPPSAPSIAQVLSCHGCWLLVQACALAPTRYKPNPSRDGICQADGAWQATAQAMGTPAAAGALVAQPDSSSNAGTPCSHPDTAFHRLAGSPGTGSQACDTHQPLHLLHTRRHCRGLSDAAPRLHWPVQHRWLMVPSAAGRAHREQCGAACSCAAQGA